MPDSFLAPAEAPPLHHPLPPLPWFDAHLDLASLAVEGRDMLRPAAEADRPHPPAAITLPELHHGRVRWVLATIFTEPGGEGPTGYPAGDAEAAHAAAVRQLDWYQRMLDAGHFAPLFDELGACAVRRDPEPIRMAVLIENADPIRSPDELAWWRGRGVIAVGMAWWKPSRYAGGNRSSEGLTPLGRELVDAIDALGMVHDLSHLSQPSSDAVLERARGRVMASHSNCRALLGGEQHPSWQRHLSDDTIRELGRRGSVIGLNLFHEFIAHAAPTDASAAEAAGAAPAAGSAAAFSTQARRVATIGHAAAHVDRIAQLQGHRHGVGLGSDMDGGLSADELPLGLHGPGDLPHLLMELRARGWSDDDLTTFAHGNWRRFLGVK